MAVLRGAPALRLGISACLLGQGVRFDGGHKRDTFLTDGLGAFVEWVPVCPEVESGMGTPRETMRLVSERGEIRLITNKTARDLTNVLQQFSAKRLEALDDERLCGFVLKKDSPSCGLERVKVYRDAGMPARSGRGVFASALVERFPTLPVEEEGRLVDPRLRENFIERIFAYRRVTDFFSGRWTNGGLVAFHTAHKMTLLAHVPEAYRRLGRLVAGVKATPRAEVRERYVSAFMEALRTIATPRRHVNVLQHMLGYFTDRLDAASRAEILALVDAYGRQQVPLVVPLTLFRHYIRRFDIEYLAGQVYLDPHPAELMLQNHV